MIEIIHVINLDANQPIDIYANTELKKQIARSREQRALSIVKQSKEQGFAVRFWPGIISEKDIFPSKNITAVFKRIVQYAKEERLAMVTIAEDDAVFTCRGAWKYYNDNLPQEFDTYSGGIYYGKLDEEEKRIISGYSGHTLITVHERFYDFFLSAGEDLHLDNWLGQWCEEKLYKIAIPFVVRQMKNTYSDNKKRVVDYEMFEKNWGYYLGV